MNSYSKQFLIIGLPVLLFLTLLFSWLAGLEEGFVPGLLLGSLVGGILSLVVGFLYSKSTREVMSDLLKERKTHPTGIKNIMKNVLPVIILLIGALLTRYLGDIQALLLLTLAFSMTAYILQSVFLGEFKSALTNKELVAYFSGIVILLVSQLIIFFNFLLVIYGFNVNKIMELF